MHLYFVLKNVQCHCTCTSDCAVRVVVPVPFVHLCAVCVVWYLIILYSLYATRHPSAWYPSICSLASVHICAIICSCLHFLFAYPCPCRLLVFCVCVCGSFLGFFFCNIKISLGSSLFLLTPGTSVIFVCICVVSLKIINFLVSCAPPPPSTQTPPPPPPSQHPLPAALESLTLEHCVLLANKSVCG